MRKKKNKNLSESGPLVCIPEFFCWKYEPLNKIAKRLFTYFLEVSLQNIRQLPAFTASP